MKSKRFFLGGFILIVLASGWIYLSISTQALSRSYELGAVSRSFGSNTWWRNFLDLFSSRRTAIPKLGKLCVGEKGCNEFCKDNFGRCKEYCRNNPQNSLCQKPFAFELPPPRPQHIGTPEKEQKQGEQKPVEKQKEAMRPAEPAFTIAEPQSWVLDVMVQSIPEGASGTRLTSLPAPLDKIFITGPYGAHMGGHVEGLDHEWIEVQEGTAVGSWADGEVTQVFLNNPNDPDDWRIYIDYGDGLRGEHMDVKTPLVKKGDKVKAGQPIAYGRSVVWLPGYHSGEFNLVDMHRRDGVLYGDGVNVSPFDYLRKDIQEQLIADYTEKFIEPYLTRGEFFKGFAPWEPYLTNPLLFHKMYKGTLAGEWFLKSKKWAIDETPDVIVLLADNTMYYDKQRMIASEDEGGWWLNGTWEADYDRRQFVMYTEDRGVYYGIFELDESGSRTTLKIEYQTGSYPTVFSEKANVYTERDNVGRRQNGYNLGVRDTWF